MPAFDWDLFLGNLFIFLPAGLGFIAFIQIVYATFLSATGTVNENVNRPTQPVMPRQSGAWSSEGLPPELRIILNKMDSGPGTGLTTDHGVSGKFIIESGVKEIQELPLPSYEFIIGRFRNEAENVVMAIDERSISRQHALFEGDEYLRQYYLTDIESTYGTFLLKKGHFEQIQPNSPERLYNQDVIQLGSKVRLRVLLPTETREQAENA